MIGGVGDVDVLAEIERYRSRQVQGERALSGHRHDQTARGYLSHSMVAGVGDIKIAGVIEGEPARQSQLGGSGLAPIAAESRASGSRKGADGCGRGYFADAVISGIGDVEVSRRVERDLPGCL